ncbi:MAG: PQQ-dependent sugar dehydrogenase [Chryseolinea sp.]
MKNIVQLLAIILTLFMAGCNPKPAAESAISTDTTAIAAGMLIFNQECSACHNFIADGIGPSLGGLTTYEKVDWIKKFISSPKAMMESGDEHAKQIIEKYKTVMPSFPKLSVGNLNNLVAFINTKKNFDKNAAPVDPNALTNPIPDTIKFSTLVANIKLFAQIPFSSDENPKTRIVKLDYQPKTDLLYILDLRGKLYFLNKGKPEVYFDMTKERKSFIHKPGLATGFGSFAFHPDFEKNGLLYTTHSEPPKTKKADFNYNDTIPSVLQWVVTEWKTTNPAMIPFQGQGRELFRIDFVSGIHGMQEATFNPYSKTADEDYGLLYIGLGDGGAVETKFPFLAHSRDKLWGTIIRIDPSKRNSKNGNYGIPDTNPFVKDADAAGEIYAYGFRNPHKITWLKSGKMMASNIGHTNIESFNMIESGHDYGWPIREGTFVHLESGNMNSLYPLPPDDAKYCITYPVIQFDHTEGKAMSSGYEYTGREVSALAGKFFYGDIPGGRLFYSQVKDIVQGKQALVKEWRIALDGKVMSIEELCGDKRTDMRIGRDSKGELYIFTKPDGKLYKIVSAKE